MADSIVKVKGLTKKWSSVVALDNVSFEVEEGKTIVILGPNGAGKTTLVEIIEGLVEPSKGEVTIWGERNNSNAIKARIGVQTEAGAFEGELKVREVLDLYASFYPVSADINRLLKDLRLSEKASSFVRDLSKGMKQKLAIAVALVNNPELIFLDEVTSGLDVESRMDIWDLIGELKRQGKTIVLTTHDMQEAVTLSDRIVILSKGKLRVNRNAAEMLSGFISRYKVEYMGEAIQLPAVEGSYSRTNKHVVFTNQIEDVVRMIAANGGYNIGVSEVSLEDIYMYEQRKCE